MPMVTIRMLGWSGAKVACQKSACDTMSLKCQGTWSTDDRRQPSGSGGGGGGGAHGGAARFLRRASRAAESAKRRRRAVTWGVAGTASIHRRGGVAERCQHVDRRSTKPVTGEKCSRVAARFNRQSVARRSRGLCVTGRPYTQSELMVISFYFISVQTGFRYVRAVTGRTYRKPV